MILEVGLLVLDIGSDFANGGKFILDGHAVVGTLTIAMVFLPGLVRLFKRVALNVFLLRDGRKSKPGENLVKIFSA